jgi:hypothetical protein
MKHAQDELVWIDGQGVAHPLGEVATQRMRLREGAYRMLPTPKHLVFMRYTGADGRRDLEDGAIVRLAGEITAPGAMCDVLAILGSACWRGELVVMDGELTRSVFFEAGNVVGVRTDAEDERLGRILYRYGAISEAQIEPVLKRTKTGQRFAQAALELGFVTQEQVYKFLARQVEEVVLAVLQLADGMFCFLDGFDEGRLPSRQVISANSLLMNHVTQLDEIRYFRPWIPSVDYVPERTPVRAPEHASVVLEAVDGQRCVGDLGRVTGLGEFEVTKQLFHLGQSGHVVMLPPRLRGGAAEAALLTSRALRTIHQAADAAGRGTALRHSLEGFAAGAYDQLLRGAGPFEDGTIDVEAVARNALTCAPGGEVEVREMLYDYAAFALFSATASLGPTGAGLAAEVERMLAKLRPPGLSGPMGNSGVYKLSPRDSGSGLVFSPGDGG